MAFGNVFAPLLLFRRKRDGKGFHLESALQELSKCCGIDCCEGIIRIKDQVTGETVEITVQNGFLVVDGDPVTPETFCAVTYTIPNTAFQGEGTLTITEGLNAEEGNTVTIGGQTYTFTATVLVANDVLIGADDDASALNLTRAINAGAGAGTLYGTGTVANASVTAANAANTVVVTSIEYGVATDAIGTTEVGDNLGWGDTTLVTPATEDILVGGVALATTYEIVSSGNSPQIASLAGEIQAGLIAAGFSPTGVTAQVVGLNYIVQVTIQTTQLAALLAIDIETDSSGALVPTNNC